MKRYVPDLNDYLGAFDLDTLESYQQPVHAISSELDLIYFNKAWAEFYTRNSDGGSLPKSIEPGAPLLDHFASSEKNYYKELYQKVLDQREVLHHEHEWHALDTFNIYAQTLYPLEVGRGVLIVNNLKVPKGTQRAASVSSEEIDKSYMKADGFYHQCSNCRKTHRNGGTGAWDWIPANVDAPPDNVSHTICPVCFEHYWKNGGQG